MCSGVNTKALLKWPVFSLLDADFRERIAFAMVFGNAGYEAIMQTNDLKVYAIGSNLNGFLGIGES